MAAKNFDAVIARVLKSEGGYSNHPKDPGGPTNLGITQKTLAAYRGGPVTAAQVKNMRRPEAVAIYKKNYADPIKFDDLPAGVDYVVLDTAINSGPSKAAKLLQGVVGVAQDGVIGAQTIAAVNKIDPVIVIMRFSSARLDFMRSLSTWSTFGKGWSTRVKEVQAAATAMAETPDAIPDVERLPIVAQAKARPVDTTTLSTNGGQSSAVGLAGTITAAAGTATATLTPFADMEHVKHALLALAVLGLAATGIGATWAFVSTRQRIARGER